MKDKWVILHTGKPYAGPIPANAWSKLSEHASAKAALRKVRNETSHLSGCSWDDHYSIIDPEGKSWSYSRLSDAVDAKLF